MTNWIGGVDGFKSRWVLVLKDVASQEMRARVITTFEELLWLKEAPSTVAVDIPIGLPEYAAPGGRACERLARNVLGKRASSVFSAVGRAVLHGPTQRDANEASKNAGGLGVGAQAWGLAKKLREVDAAMNPSAQAVVREVHPEVCFWALNGKVPMPSSKKTGTGERDRQNALILAGFPRDFIETKSGLNVPADDFLDACAALWTAGRIAGGSAERFPKQPDRDSRGLDQAIWF